MDWIVHKLWLIPALPLLAAGLTALLKQRRGKLSASLAILAMLLALGLSCWALVDALQHPGHGAPVRQGANFFWFEFGDPQASSAAVWLGWVLDPLSAIMLVMVSLVGLLIFIYSLGYMAHDENFTRFFCFLSLFAAAMLGLVIANSLLLLFICWEIVGLTSYLLIGFWYHKPSAAAAAKKAFITTRIGDLALLLGMVWLYAKTGTLLFYDGGNGCLETPTLAKAFPILDFGALPLLGIALLIFVGAMGKSGQFPLHVWLPDAMEGPTPVSALIHAATMVAAGVFLVARVFALMKPDWAGMAGPHTLVTLAPPDATVVITWVGAITAVFAASIALAQMDIKRILAYSTVSQLGFMMLGLGTGGVAVGMFHLITHAFFKALLFLGAGSVIHGCHEEQDIRRMGGLRKLMPVTFTTYAIGMLALSGFPLVVSGFWSKDEILHSAKAWSVSHWPFYLGAFGALLTAFYMTRQVCYVFLGSVRSSRREEAHSGSEPPHVGCYEVDESPAVMTIPLIVLAAFAVLLGFVGTPGWPWFQAFLNGQPLAPDPKALVEPEVLWLMVLSTVVVLAGMALGWWLYGRRPRKEATEPDVLERIRPDIFALLSRKYFVDEVYEASVVRFNAWWASACDWLDSRLWNGAVNLASYAVVGLSWLNRLFDEYVVNPGFDGSCRGLREGGTRLSRLQSGRVQSYLRVIGVGLAVLVLLLMWGCHA
jgi:NADH-quinone oxidoreductase subunit L